MTVYESLTGFKPRGKAPIRILLDYSYGEGKMVEHCGAQTIDAAILKARKLPHWSSNRVRIVNITEVV